MQLYLLKSSRYREYQQENVRLLGAPAGARARLRYHQRWLASDVSRTDLLGREALVVLADSPWQRFTPLRLGRVLAAHLGDEHLELELELTAYPAPGAPLEHLDRWLAERLAAQSPPRLVFCAAAQVTGAPIAAGGDAVLPWQQTIDRILSGDAARFYEESLFLLPLDLRDEGQHRPATPAHLPTGQGLAQRLYSYNAHLGAEDLRRRRLHADYDHGALGLLEELPPLPADGTCEVRFELLRPGAQELRLVALPFGEQSSRLTLALHGQGEAVVRVRPGPDRPSPATVRGLHGLWSLLERSGVLADASLGRELLELLLAMAPDDPTLLRAQAHLHARRGDHQQALLLFRRLGVEALAPGDWLPYFMAACQAHEPVEALAEILDHLPWAEIDSARAHQIGRAVAGLKERSILDLLESLAYHYTERFLADIWSELRPVIASRDGILRAHGIMNETRLASPAGAFEYLWERSRDEGLRDAAIDTWLVEHALHCDPAPPQLAEVLVRHLRREAERDDPTHALSRLYQARAHLGPGDYAAVRLALADQLAAAPSDTARPLAATLLAEAAEDELRQGDLPQAAHLLERSLLLDPAGAHAAQLEPRLQAALERSAPLAERRAALLDTRLAQLRQTLAGRRVLIVGGPAPKAWAEDLRLELALAELRWFPSSPRDPPRSEAIAEAAAGAGAIAILSRCVGHSAADAARAAAERHAVPCATLRHGTSRDALLLALLAACGL